jgi:hypothetical protein
MSVSKYPREFLIAELKRVARHLGTVPTLKEFRQHASVSPATQLVQGACLRGL